MKMEKISTSKNRGYGNRIKQRQQIYAVKLKTESNGLGVLKTLMVLSLIAVQGSILILTYLFFLQAFQWYFGLSVTLSLLTCIYVLSSDIHGQAKATWVFFLLFCFGFGFAFYFMSDKHILFVRAKRKYKKIGQKTLSLQRQLDLTSVPTEIRSSCDLLFNAGNFVASNASKCTYFSSGTQLFDDILANIAKAKKFIFMEYYIISNGVLLNKFLKLLSEKAKTGVDVRIIYDDMGSHGTLKRKTKKQILNAGIKLQDFNRLIPIFNIALNLRDHRKIIIIDGEISYTGGSNLADEYVNEKRMHGYWKDEGIKIEGPATDNFTIAFLTQWEYITKENVDFTKFINLATSYESSGIAVPFVSGPNYQISIAQNIYANQISSAQEKLYIMTPYFVPDETISNLLKNKAQSGVDVRIILPDVPDKRFVYTVSRNNAEKMMEYGVKIYTMKDSFVHSKVVLTESSAIVGSINMDLRSFFQQFESAVLTNQPETLQQISQDFEFSFEHSVQIIKNSAKRNKTAFRIKAGLFNLISPFM